MNGPDQFREAERIAAAAKSLDVANREGFTGWSRQELTDLAQVHATLALAAATICAGNARTEIRDDGSTVTDIAQGADWAEVLS